MSPRIVPLLSALLLTLACDSGQTDAKKPAPKKAESKKAESKPKGADAAKTDAVKADATKTAAAKADAKADEATKADAPAAEDEAKKAEERKARIAKALAELDDWTSKEKERWTEALETEVKTLVETEHKDIATALAAALAGKHRHPDNVARDQYRHPAKTLAFMGLTPQMTVIEVGPGWGWYTELLAPVLARSGKLQVTTYDPAGPEDQGRTVYARRLKAFMDRSETAYGKIEPLIQTPDAALNLGPDGTADMVFVARGLHGWVNSGKFDENLTKVHAALKPGGIAAIVQHRAADDGKTEDTAKQGYLPQPWVVQKFEAAGFTLEEASEVNANAKDTKDHPEGVWTLPPTLALEDKDRDKYLAIGESDRMTLRFRKK
ncbi:MAG: hypothetical protein AAGF11_20610 [Myxococcota bacterium]